MRRVLLVDNHDSFTWNLAHQLLAAGARVEVVANDAWGLEAVQRWRPTHVVLSPGPGHPAVERDFGVCGPILDALSHSVPILGVCLGHQGLAGRLGARIELLPAPVHGRASWIHHDGRGLFAGLPNPFQAMRYHSLVVGRSGLPSTLEVSAWLDDGTVMGLRRHGTRAQGVQFHPESVGTPLGDRLMRAFLET